MAANNTTLQKPKSERLGVAVSSLIILLVLAALAGPKILGLGKAKGFQTISASRHYPAVKIGVDPKVIDQALSGTNAVTHAQIKALLQTQEASATTAIEQANQRAEYAEEQADKWQEEVAVYHAKQDREADDKKIQTVMMIVLTVAIMVLVVFAITSKSMPAWAKDVAKTAAGAIITAWIK